MFTICFVIWLTCCDLSNNINFLDYTDLKQDKKRMDHFTSLCVVLFEFLQDISLPNTVELMGMYGRVCNIQIPINKYTISNIMSWKEK